MDIKKKSTLATAGLIFITVLAAVQYIFLKNVPENLPSFAFICITNAIGFVLIGVFSIKKIMSIKKKTLLKGLLFAVELVGFNFFVLLGSRHLDSVIISSVVSLYFVFVTPFMLILKRPVNFFSGIASIVATIALLLMFGASPDALISSPDVLYLLIGDIFFAAYVVSVSELGKEEDSLQLTFSQLGASAVLGLVGWFIEGGISGTGVSIPMDKDFWISAIFIGVFIRALYGIIQIESQKYVSPIKTSLIFSSEIIITLIANPFMSTFFGQEYSPATVFQIVGCVLFVIATLMVDDGLLEKWGYGDLNGITVVDEEGNEIRKSSVSRKMILLTLTFSVVTLVLSTITGLVAINVIQNTSVSSSRELGDSASTESSEALTKLLEDSIVEQANDKRTTAYLKLEAYADASKVAASHASELLSHMGDYVSKEVDIPHKENAGEWVMQRTLANESITYNSVRKYSGLLGNMEEILRSVKDTNDSIATIYMGIEEGLMVSYDPYSDSGDTGDGSEGYFEFRERDWYKQVKATKKTFFTDSYQDGYGRGLTISCVTPIIDEKGKFRGCLAIDILMSDLNESMVNDGVVNPNEAMLVDANGGFIAGKGVDPTAEDTGSIFDDPDTVLAHVGKEMLKQKNGVLKDGEGDDAMYVSFSYIEYTNWILCIVSPVSTVIEPAVNIRNNIEANTQNVINSVIEIIKTIIQVTLIFTALIVLFITVFVGRASKRVSEPLKVLETDVREISNGNLDRRTEVETDDEIGSLAVSFNHMTDSLQQYVKDLKDATAKEERLAGELGAATKIQADMLPRNFPPFPDREEIDLFASMDPAKEVGGDFYDFFLVDEDHLALIIADVSGKGVPAALFMVIAKTLIKDQLQMGKSVDEALREANNMLAENNAENLFVTAWASVIDLKTGKLEFADAGHETAFILRSDGTLDEVNPSKKKLPLAAMEGIKYVRDEVTVNVGDKIFVYTDGVPEATNGGEELYGMDRLRACLKANMTDAPEELLKHVRGDVDAFVGAAEQFDDLTMLSYLRKA